MGKEKMAENGGFFEAQKAPFVPAGAGASKHKPLIWLLLCRPTFLAPESKKNVGRHFSEHRSKSSNTLVLWSFSINNVSRFCSRRRLAQLYSARCEPRRRRGEGEAGVAKVWS
jgi:hypothetical protein